MEEHLTIRNFGPIREAEIDVCDLTVFVGPQATGKSLAAQSLYFLRRIEDLIPPYHLPPIDATLTTMTRWFGNKQSVYATPGTLLRWSSPEPSGEGATQIQWKKRSVSLSETLEDRLSGIVERQHHGPAHIYIPAGRILFSFLPPYFLPAFFAYQSRTPSEWPGYILKFYETLGRTTRWLWQQEHDQQHMSHLPDDNPEAAFVQQRIDAIVRGRFRFGPDSVELEIEGKYLHVTSVAAGQMEIWPFWAILEAGIQAKRLEFAQIYFEEPEAHLHPGAQRNVMEIIAYLVRHNTRFIITTHSPYILYAVNNFLMAQKVLDAGRTLPDGVPPETALRPDQVAAYRFAPDGTVHDIMDAEVGLIDGDELERVADDLGSTFVDLQERLEGVA